MPALDAGSFGLDSGGRFEFVDRGHQRFLFRRGRYALYAAYRIAGVGPEGAVLIPAYHCRTMLDPALDLRGHVVLYRLGRNLAPDIDALESAVRSSSFPVRALLLTHYFGFAQRTTEVVELCRRRRICLIEDCTHALIDDRTRPSIGCAGAFVVASPYKFLPCEEGGWLIPRAQELGVDCDLARSSIRAEAKVLAAVARNAFGRLLDLRERARPTAALWTNGGWPELDLWKPEVLAGPSELYDPGERSMSPTLASRSLACVCAPSRVAQRRQKNYRRLAELLGGVRCATPLWPDLPEGTVPYMFPLLIETPDVRSFYRLKAIGVPIWRWDEMAVSDCDTARAYRLRLLHLPCHQSLSDADIEWMASAIRACVETG